MPYISVKDLDRLKEVRRIATMESASWTMDESRNDEIRETIRLWMRSWIYGPLDEILVKIESQKSSAIRKGSRVRVRSMVSVPRSMIGRLGRVVMIAKGDSLPYYVQLDGDRKGNESDFRASELELVE